MHRPYTPEEVMPAVVAGAVADLPYWFVIGGQAVRCFCPYRPSHDVDFGVDSVRDAADFVRQLRRKGAVEVIEQHEHTLHLSFEGIDVSVFVLRELRPHAEAGSLTVTGLLATKLHAILERGTRRDFFDLYVLLQQHQLGIVECLRAMRLVYAAEVNEGLMLRALVYFDDAEAEAPLPGEGLRDWERVKDYFIARAGALVLPPEHRLEVQAGVVDVRPRASRAPRRSAGQASSSTRASTQPKKKKLRRRS